MIQIAILGFGVVGSGTAEVLTENQKLIQARLGEGVNIKYILDLREFPEHPLGDRVVHDIHVILQDPEVSVVAEMMGGSHPAYEFSRMALEAGKSVVTSNKEVVANFGVELLELARSRRVSYLFEASVGGGIPIIRPMQADLACNNIYAVSGILNGTTNFILTKMKNEGADFADALQKAQANGFAEADPTADVEGLDAARKIVILAALAFGILISPDRISTKGITGITKEQTETAESFGGAVKLIGHTEQLDGRTLAMVAPHFVPASNPLSHIEGVFNGVLVNTDMLGRTLFYGAGAGKLPTASAVVSDILNAIPGRPLAALPMWRAADDAELAAPAERSCRRLLMLEGCAKCAEGSRQYFGHTSYTVTEGKFACITRKMTDAELAAAIEASEKTLCWSLPVLD